MTIVQQYLADLEDNVYVSPEKQSVFKYSPSHLDELYTTFPDLNTVIRIKEEKFILMPTPNVAMNLHDVMDRFPSYFKASECQWCKSLYQRAFIDEFILPGKWLAIRRTVYKPFINSTWPAQLEVLPDGMYVPRAVELAYTMAMYAKVYERHLFGSWMNRTSTVTADHKNVSIGLFKFGCGMSIQAEEKLKKKTTLLLALGLRLQPLT